jgi:hypothetical protein
MCCPTVSFTATIGHGHDLRAHDVKDGSPMSQLFATVRYCKNKPESFSGIGLHEHSNIVSFLY